MEANRLDITHETTSVSCLHDLHPLQTEAQTSLEAVTSETTELREKIRQLEVENDKLKVSEYSPC